MVSITSIAKIIMAINTLKNRLEEDGVSVLINLILGAKVDFYHTPEHRLIRVF